MDEALIRAKAAAQGPVALAKALSERGHPITSQAVGQWKRVPAERVLDVEAITGVSRHDLRPDLYPREHITNGAGSAQALA